MHVRRLIPLMAPLGVVGAAVIATQSVAFAYPTPPASGTVVSGCSTLAQGASCNYVFQFVDSSGNPIQGLLAAIGLDAVPGCAVSPSSATSTGNGEVTGTLSCASNSGTGSEQVIATSGDVTLTANVQIVAGSQGTSNNNGTTLPDTSTAPGPNVPLIGGLTAAAALLLGGGVYLIRGRKATA
jgi:hypothetical protein